MNTFIIIYQLTEVPIGYLSSYVSMSHLYIIYIYISSMLEGMVFKYIRDLFYAFRAAVMIYIESQKWAVFRECSQTSKFVVVVDLYR